MPKIIFAFAIFALVLASCESCGPVVVSKATDISIEVTEDKPHYKIESGALPLSEDSVYRWVLITGYNPLTVPVLMHAHCKFFLDGGDYEVFNEQKEVDIPAKKQREVKFQTNYNRHSNPSGNFFRDCTVTFTQ